MTPSPIAPPHMQPVQPELNGRWYVLVTWPEGNADQVDGFASERAAEDWIEIESLSWETALRAAAR